MFHMGLFQTSGKSTGAFLFHSPLEQVLAAAAPSPTPGTPGCCEAVFAEHLCPLRQAASEGRWTPPLIPKPALQSALPLPAHCLSPGSFPPLHWEPQNHPSLLGCCCIHPVLSQQGQRVAVPHCPCAKAPAAQAQEPPGVHGRTSDRGWIRASHEKGDAGCRSCPGGQLPTDHKLQRCRGQHKAPHRAPASSPRWTPCAALN